MTDHSELKRLADEALRNWADSKLIEHSECERFIDAANPAAVLALIAEFDRLKVLRSTAERDLSQELEVWRNGPSCWNCGDTGDAHDMTGEWRGKCDCNTAKLIDVASERDQLKAEVARSTEREIMQLAEIEALRKDAERYRWTATEGNWVARMFGKWRAHIGKYGDARPTEWFDSREEAIDAAITKGKQP